MPALSLGHGGPATDNAVLLQASLDLAVPLRIADLQAAGGPSEEDRERARAFLPDLQAHGDNLLHRSSTRGETARLWAQLVHAIAVLSFQPGGVKLFGRRWNNSGEGQQTE